MKHIAQLLIVCILAPFSLLPLRWSQAVGAKLGLFLIKCNRKRAHIAQCNLRSCFPEKRPEEIKQLVRLTAIESGKWFIESGYVWFRNPEYLIRKTTVKNPELLADAYAKQRGVVIILPHLGNWELLNFYVPQNYPFGAMYKPLDTAWFERIVLRSRCRAGTSMFPTNSSGVRRAMKSLKKSHTVAILADHLPSVEAGIYAPFFGRPALTGKLTQTLLKSNHSEIILASALRKPNGEGFEIEFHHVEDISGKSVAAAAAAINQAIEESIRLAPEQYQWVYRRFGKPPKAAVNIYK